MAGAVAREWRSGMGECSESWGVGGASGTPIWCGRAIALAYRAPSQAISGAERRAVRSRFEIEKEN